MTQSAWPFSGQTVSEAQFRAWARQAFGSRIYQGLTVSTSTTGRQLTVGAGLAIVDGCAYMSDATVTLDVDANTTGQSRRVYAVLRLDPTSTPQIQLVTVNGPAGGGAATFTQTDTGIYEFPLAYATVTAGQAGGWSSATSGAVMLARAQSAKAELQTGTLGVVRNGIAGGSWWKTHVTFPLPFAETPAVWGDGADAIFTFAAKEITTTGMDVYIRNNDVKANQLVIYPRWYAYGPLSAN